MPLGEECASMREEWASVRLAGDPRCESGEPSAVSHVERGAARQVPPLNMDRAERLEMGKWRVTNRENKWESVGECDIWERKNGRV